MNMVTILLKRQKQISPIHGLFGETMSFCVFIFVQIISNGWDILCYTELIGALCALCTCLWRSEKRIAGTVVGQK